MTNATETVLTKLGGKKFLAMTGAVVLAGEGNAIFKLPSTSRASAIEIGMEAADTYMVQLYRGRGLLMARHGEPLSLTSTAELRALFMAEMGPAVS